MMAVGIILAVVALIFVFGIYFARKPYLNIPQGVSASITEKYRSRIRIYNWGIAYSMAGLIVGIIILFLSIK